MAHKEEGRRIVCFFVPSNKWVVGILIKYFWGRFEARYLADLGHDDPSEGEREKRWGLGFLGLWLHRDCCKILVLSIRREEFEVIIYLEEKR